MRLFTHLRLRSVAMLMLMLCLCTATSWAQGKISGTVTDSDNIPLPGVSVLVKGTNKGVATDINGKYTINANKGDVIIFRYIGMQPRTVKSTSNVLNVTLEEDGANLDELVVVGYGTQRRGTITGAVSQVSGKEIINAPTMSISNMVGARVAGISAKQTSGQPGSDNATLQLRGQTGIVYVIDGVRRTSDDFNQMDPNEVESVSILKDAASVAIYGLDANGVIIVTTKRGSSQKTQINYTGTFGISQNAEEQEWLDGPGYAYWFNKGLEMDGLSPKFTDEMIEKMRLGIDGWGNTNWYKEIFGTGWRTSHNVSASGGNDKVNFFASIGYLKEEGNVDNFAFDRWNLRSNIEAKITNNLTFSVGVSARIQKHDNPYYSADPDAYGNIGSQMVRSLPYVPKTVDYEGRTLYTGMITNGMNMSALASIYNNGYTRYDKSYAQTNFTLRYDAPFLKGLSAKFTGAYDAGFNFSKQLNNPAEIMLLNNDRGSIFTGTDVLEYVHYYNFNNNYIALTEGSTKYSTFTTNTTVSYDNTFGLHHVGALLLAETRQYNTNNIGAYGRGLDFISLDELSNVTNQTFDGQTKNPSVSGSSSMTRSAGFAGRFNYNYDERYFLEATMRYDGSYLFGGSNDRWVVLPGASLGWRINREDFFDVDWVNNLKIRAGYGRTATSGVSAFSWRNKMSVAQNGVVIGGNSTSYITASTLGNPNLTWSKCDNYNIGVDANLWNSLLGIEADVFYKYEFDVLSSVTGSYAPSMGGYYFSQANVNKKDYKGFDLTLTHTNKIGDFNYGVKLIWSYAYGRWVYYAGDSENAPEYQRLTGKQIGVKRGFIADGLYQTEEEIANGPLPSHSPKGVLPGQIRYVDRNGDGKITYADDMGWVGKSNMPTHTGSLNLNGDWHGFDFDMLFSWGLGHSVALTGEYTATGSEGIMDGSSFTVPFKWYGNSPVFLVENSWTPEHTNAEWPRLCATPQNNNDAYSSTFWYKNGDYIRLKTAQIGYTVPQKLIKSSGITRLRFFAEGYNLLTFSGLSKFNIDPESPAVNNGYYPQQRKVAFGVNLSF